MILQTVKYYKRKFEKVILTTNGTNLYDYMEKIDGIVDHINISRHHHDNAIRKKIFGMNIISDRDLEPIIKESNELGIDVTFNSVLCNEIKTKQNVLDFIEYAKSMGASAVTFRKDYNEDCGLGVSGVEKYFENYKSTYTYSCPVCRTKVQLINGMKTTWKSSSFEPSDNLKDIYEMILQSNGKLTIDWAGEKEISFTNGKINNANKKTKELLKDNKSFGFLNSNMAQNNFVNRQCELEALRYIASNHNGCGVPTRSHSGCGVTSKHSGCGGSVSTSNYGGCGG